MVKNMEHCNEIAKLISVSFAHDLLVRNGPHHCNKMTQKGLQQINQRLPKSYDHNIAHIKVYEKQMESHIIQFS